MENKPPFLFVSWTRVYKEKVGSIGLGNEGFLGDMSAGFPAPFIAQKAWQLDEV